MHTLCRDGKGGVAEEEGDWGAERGSAEEGGGDA